MSLICFIYNWELFINSNNNPIIIGFGYDKLSNKLALVIEDFPYYKYSDQEPSILSIKDYQIYQKHLLRSYLDGKKNVYKSTFSDYNSYLSVKVF